VSRPEEIHADAKDTKDAGPKEGGPKPEKARGPRRPRRRRRPHRAPGRTAAPVELPAVRGRRRSTRRRAARRIGERPVRICNVHASFNNTVDQHLRPGRERSYPGRRRGASAFKGSRKGTPFEAQLRPRPRATPPRSTESGRIEVRVTGPGSRDANHHRALQAIGLESRRSRTSRRSAQTAAARRKRRRV